MELEEAVEFVKKKRAGEVDENGKEIIGRLKASARGWKRYYTGVECNQGHRAERYVNGGQCVECVRLKKNR